MTYFLVFLVLAVWSIPIYVAGQTVSKMVDVTTKQEAVLAAEVARRGSGVTETDVLASVVAQGIRTYEHTYITGLMNTWRKYFEALDATEQAAEIARIDAELVRLQE